MTKHFGEHLTIDGYDCNKEKLNDKDLVFRILNELPGKLGMKKLSEPEIYHCEGNDTKDPGGWTGVVTINESHISIHTFVGTGFVTADVYTCHNGLDVDFILKYFTEAFDIKEIEQNFIKRGEKYSLYVK